MSKTSKIFLFIVASVLFFSQNVITLSPAANAADFQLSNPGIELRRLQICENCSEPLVVTSIAPGAAVRCPKCQRVQRRLPDSELIVKVYQICPSCSQRLDVSNLEPMEAFRCGACNFEQRVLPEAVYNPPSNSGKGKIPAKKIINPSARLLPKKKEEIPEAIVPGLNAPEGAMQEDYDIEIEDFTPGKKPAKNKIKPRDTGTQRKPESDTPDTSGSYLNLPEMDNDIEGNVSILVNGEAIYESSIMRRILDKFENNQTKNNQQLSIKDKAKFYSKFRKDAENELINELLIMQEAKRCGIPDTTTPNSDYTTTLSSYKKQLLETKHQKTNIPSTAELVKYYKNNIKDYSYPDQLVLDSIVIYNDRTRRRDNRNSNIISSEVKERLDKGVDFTLLASRYSEGAFHNEGGRIRKVDSELIPSNFLIKPLRNKKSSLQSGDMFGPIELPTCKLFVQVSKVKYGKTIPFNTVKDKVEKAVTAHSIETAFNQWLINIRKAAVIEYKK